MITFDSFSAYDGEQDMMRFRCFDGVERILCAVTRAALVDGEPAGTKTRADLAKLYEMRTEMIRRAVLRQLKRAIPVDGVTLVVDVGDM